MKKLTYTVEMQEQDKLWETEKEDRELMKKLYQQIMDEAIQCGYVDKYSIYDVTEEAVCEIFKNEEERIANYEIGESTYFGYCKPLINALEKILQ